MEMGKRIAGGVRDEIRGQKDAVAAASRVTHRPQEVHSESKLDGKKHRAKSCREILDHSALGAASWEPSVCCIAFNKP